MLVKGVPDVPLICYACDITAVIISGASSLNQCCHRNQMGLRLYGHWLICHGNNWNMMDLKLEFVIFNFKCLLWLNFSPKWNINLYHSWQRSLPHCDFCSFSIGHLLDNGFGHRLITLENQIHQSSVAIVPLIADFRDQNQLDSMLSPGHDGHEMNDTFRRIFMTERLEFEGHWILLFDQVSRDNKACCLAMIDWVNILMSFHMNEVSATYLNSSHQGSSANKWHQVHDLRMSCRDLA